MRRKIFGLDESSSRPAACDMSRNGRLTARREKTRRAERRAQRFSLWLSPPDAGRGRAAGIGQPVLPIAIARETRLL